MNTGIYWMVAGSLLLGIAYGFGTYRSYADAKRDRQLGERERFTPALLDYFPFSFCVLLSIYIVMELFSIARGRMIAQLTPLLFCVAAYFGLLLLVLPLLRRWFSARACALLWLIPLGLMCRQMLLTNWGDLPILLVHIPFGVSEQVFRVVLWVWFGGFVGILCWNIVSHLLFRRWLMKDARPITFGPMLEVLIQEEQFANVQGEPYPLWVSRRVKTPLSIGLFRRTTCIVLPKKDYGRSDSAMKFLIAFYTAVFWFFPLMWVAVRRFADDLELSCDETVLVDSEDAVRQQYAGLLLDTVADQRGFTTCLSASARALRYRLKNVVGPRKRLAGGVMVGVVTFLLTMLCFSISFSFDPGTAAERIFREGDPALYELGSVKTDEVSYSEGDGAAVMGYLLGLEVAQLSEEYSLIEQPGAIQIHVFGPEENYTLIVTQRYMRVDTYTESGRTEKCYYLSTPVDREYLLSLVDAS